MEPYTPTSLFMDSQGLVPPRRVCFLIQQPHLPVLVSSTPQILTALVPPSAPDSGSRGARGDKLLRNRPVLDPIFEQHLPPPIPTRQDFSIRRKREKLPNTKKYVLESAADRSISRPGLKAGRRRFSANQPRALVATAVYTRLPCLSTQHHSRHQDAGAYADTRGFTADRPPARGYQSCYVTYFAKTHPMT